jgi:hypothetical protein
MSKLNSTRDTEVAHEAGEPARERTISGETGAIEDACKNDKSEPEPVE